MPNSRRADTKPQRTDTKAQRADTKAQHTGTEPLRTDAEPQRTDAEAQRTSTEPLRADAKPPGADAESRRVDAESRRVDAESRRVDAEPRRADARRNRQRILQAAMEAFATEGRLVPLDDIARRAGVGAGTVYRNFPTKEALFTAVVTDRLRDIVEEARALGGADDPGEQFYGFLMWVVERAMFNHALCDALALEEGIKAFAVGLEEEFNEALEVLLRRAQDAGQVRADVDIRDVRALMAGCMVTERMRRADGPPGRMTALACDALRPTPVTKLDNETRSPSRNEGRCEVCGTPLTAARTGRPARFCGAACRQKAHRRRSAAPKSG
ncbi:TetR/AcrR family transcriptional regulator [Actinomadura opuntiae]|uniref:TetR/AcrR family transcriptional regulator n=1 Tax=Actinomadura sp. OS1-43 TaxID=604315 RepID=UPI00255B2DF6|nr:TetR family transcriptional regulator [Actinomadura sp. OS1-43]MDL4813938.1 TetR family transcriptional regulator [Actinomadura sp. OS1-43]